MEAYVNSLINKLKLNESLVSSILGAGVVLIIGLILYNIFSSRSTTSSTLLDLPSDTKLENEVELNQANDSAIEVPSTHVVETGENLWSIAEKYYGSGYNWVDIANENKSLLKSPNLIETGQTLNLAKVPARQRTVIATADSSAILSSATVNPNLAVDSNSYIVQRGDSLWKIAVRAYSDGYQWPKLYEANRDAVGTNPNFIEPDTTLSIPRD